MDKFQAEVLVKGDISPFEQEALYNHCLRIFTLINWDNESLDYDNDYVTEINFIINTDFSSQFFENITEKNWNELLNLLKDMRSRRGSHSAHVHLRFNGVNSKINIHCISLSKDGFINSLDSIKSIIIGLNLVSNDNLIQEKNYSFDEKSMLWISD